MKLLVGALLVLALAGSAPALAADDCFTAPLSTPAATPPVEATAGLRPYRVFVRDDLWHSPDLDAADLVAAISGMAGVEIALSFPTPGVADAIVGVPDGTSQTTLESACAIAGVAQTLFGELSKESTAEVLEYFSSFFSAGRYDFSAALFDIAGTLVPENETTVENEIGLGQTLFEMVRDRLTGIEVGALNLSPLTLEFTDNQGLLSYSDGRIRLDARAFRRMMVFDYFFMRQGGGSLDDCFESTDGTQQAVLCANVFTRARVRPEDIVRRHIERDPMVTFRLATRISEWKEAYDRPLLEALFAETWNFIRAAAAAATSGLTGCVEVAGWDISALPAAACPEEDRSDPVWSVLARGPEPVLRWYQIALAHELAHHALGHSPDLLNETAANVEGRDFPNSGMDPDYECSARVILEAQADVVGAALFREVTAGKAMGYFGEPLPAVNDMGLWDASSEIGARMFASWSPFFGGYLVSFESDADRCGYYLATSRHVLWQGVYFATGDALESLREREQSATP